MDVIWSGSPMNLQPTITKQIENGRIKVTITADLIPRKNKLRLRTKNVANEKLFISSLNFLVVYDDSS